MASPRAFISFDYDNDSLMKLLFAGQSKNEKTRFTIEDWSAKSAMKQSEWEKIIHEKIKKTNFLVVLVGNHMSTATGVKKEIDMAIANNIPIFGVYVNGATSTSTLPSNMPRSRVVAWDHDKIATMIDKVMGEGKNKA